MDVFDEVFDEVFPLSSAQAGGSASNAADKTRIILPVHISCSRKIALMRFDGLPSLNQVLLTIPLWSVRQRTQPALSFGAPANTARATSQQTDKTHEY